MNITIHTRPQGVLFIDMPFIEEDIYKRDSIFKFISKWHIHVFRPSSLGKALAQEIKDFLHGESFRFSDYPISWPGITTFGKTVLFALKDVPHSKTLSYMGLPKILVALMQQGL